MAIRVLLVEDSPVALKVLTRILQQSPQIELVGTACSGVEALELIPQVQPQVICTDLHMPKMDGLELTSEIMDRFPLPILVISVSVQAEDTKQVFQLLDAGAVDIFPKPIAGLTTDNLELNQELVNKIRVLSGVRVFRKKRVRAKSYLSTSPLLSNKSKSFQPRIVAVGASTGGPQALQNLFRQLPSHFPPLICVQHISTGFLEGLINWLQQDCILSVEIAQAQKKPEPGHIYFPPENYHLALDKHGQFFYLDSPPVNGHRPAINVTFDSVAQYYGKHAVGILLTGMGQDGALGLKSIRQAGGFTIAQDESTCVVFGMPKVAIELDAAHQVLPIQAIAPNLINYVHG